jgi:hypothetical protein
MTMTLKEYLTPQTAILPPAPSGEWWAPPAPSRGLRHFKFANKGSARGVAIIDDTCVESESLAERKGTLVLWARPDTLRVVEQSPQVEYVDADGVVRIHTFDLTVFRDDGIKVAADFKPAKLVNKSAIRALHKLLGPQMSPRTADELLVMTERMYTRDDVFNATLMHTLERQDYPEHDAAILKLITRMKRPAPIADLVEKSRLKSYGFGAVVRAITTGDLRVVERCRIDYPALVAPAPRQD